MSFGFGVGDFIAVGQLILAVHNRFMGAPDQIRAIATEVKQFANVVDDIKEAGSVPGRQLTAKQKNHEQECLSGCTGLLRDLEAFLDRYQPVSRRGKMRNAWKRLALDPQDVRDLRARLSSHILLLNSFRASLDRNTVEEISKGVSRLNVAQDNRHCLEMIDWLSPIDFVSQQTNLLNSKEAETGSWLLQSPEFQLWLNGTQKTMFCPGIPGSGKTYLTCTVIEHLSKTFDADETVGLAHVYCNYKLQLEQTLDRILASLLQQLCRQMASLPASVVDFCQKHRRLGSRPTIEELLQILDVVLSTFSRVFISIDALDECSDTGRSRTRLLKEIFRLQDNIGVQVFATSRYHGDIDSMFKARQGLSLEILAHDEDVCRYLDSHMDNLAACVRKDVSLQEKIKKTIVEAVDGMFLLAKLHMDALSGKRWPRAIQTALESLPTGPDALSRAYDEALKRIDGQNGEAPTFAKEILMWITYAKRPLKVDELQHGLAYTACEGDTSVDEVTIQDFVIDVEEVLSVCAGLVVLDQETKIIRLAHYTTQEFLTQATAWLPNGHPRLAIGCMWYLSLEVLTSRFCTCDLSKVNSFWGCECAKTSFYEDCSCDKSFMERLQMLCLREYAVQNWSYHTHLAPEAAVLTEVTRIADDPDISSMIMRKWSFMNRYEHILLEPGPLDLPNGLCFAAFADLCHYSRLCLDRDFDVNIQSGHGRSPIHYATGRGHENMTRLLLTEAETDVESVDTDGYRPLQLAITNGHKTVARLLLEAGIEVNARDSSGLSALHQAVVKRADGCMTMLLLEYATVKGDTSSVKPFSSRIDDDDVDVDARTLDGRTALSYSAQYGPKSFAPLLTLGANPDSRDAYGRSPLSYAAESRHAEVAKLLLDEGVEADCMDSFGRTPLSYAAENGEDTFKFLVERDDVAGDSRDLIGRSPLSHAAGSRIGLLETVMILANRADVDADSKDFEGRTPLYWALSCLARDTLMDRQRKREIVGWLAARRDVDASCLRMLPDWDKPDDPKSECVVS